MIGSGKALVKCGNFFSLSEDGDWRHRVIRIHEEGVSVTHSRLPLGRRGGRSDPHEAFGATVQDEHVGRIEERSAESNTLANLGGGGGGGGGREGGGREGGDAE